MRRDFLITGIITRTLVAILIIVLQTDLRFNDMSEIIYLGIQNMIHGTNPYSVTYELHWGLTTFYQPLNYGPLTLIFYLPAMLWPTWIGSIWLGMAVMINVYSYLYSETLCKLVSKDAGLQKYAKIKVEDIQEENRKNERTKDGRVNRVIYYGGCFLWAIPFGSMPITVFIFMPAWLVILAYYYRDNYILSGLFLGLASFSYQLCFLFIPVYIAYILRPLTSKRIKSILKGTEEGKADLKKMLGDLGRFILGLTPALAIFGVFLLWGNNAYDTIYSLFLYTKDMGYVKAPGAGVELDKIFWSIPKWAYILSNGALKIGNIARLIMFIILGGLALFYLFSDKIKDDIKFLHQYQIIAVVLFILTTNYGGLHYFIFMVFPIIALVQLKHPDFHK
ncbi:MAG: hypothetical protein ACTSVC_06645 [Promethearchaeota archaeon]